MESLKKILVTILVMSVSFVFSQKKEGISIFETKDTLVLIEIDFHKYDKKNKTFLEKSSIRNAEIYFNDILQKLNLRVNSISGGGIANIELTENVGFRIIYGTLKLDKDFSNIRLENGKRLEGEVLGFDMGISLKKKKDFKLFLSIGNNWIRLENGKKFSSPRVSIGIRIKN